VKSKSYVCIPIIPVDPKADDEIDKYFAKKPVKTKKVYINPRKLTETGDIMKKKMEGPIPVPDKTLTCNQALTCENAGNIDACRNSDGSRCESYVEVEIIRPKIKFGKRITVTAEFRRHWKRKPRNKVSSIGTSYKFWSKLNYMQSRTGIFLGYRFIRDGFIERTHDEGDSFIMDKQHKVALVCLSERENPIYVPLDSIE